MKNKKAIGAIVSISLLLIVATVSVVSFSSWYDTFQNNLENKIETSSVNLEAISIQRIQKDGIDEISLFVRNPNNRMYFVDEIKINNEICEIYGNNVLDSKKTQQINLFDCNYDKGEQVNILITTKDNIFQESGVIR